AYSLEKGGSGASSSSTPTSSTGSSSSAQTSSSGLSGGPFNTPGNLLITDQLNNRVIELDPLTNQIVWSFGSNNGTLCNPGPGSIIGPNDAERLAGGLTLISGTGNPSGIPGVTACMDNRVIIVNQQGNITWQYGEAGVNGSGPDQLNVPVFAVQLPDGNVLITDQGNDRVIEVNSTKQIVWSYGPSSGPGTLKNPNSAELLPNGDVLISDQNNNRVIEVDQGGNIVWQYSTGLQTASFASRLPNNDTLIADAGHSRIVEVNPAGEVVWQYFTNDTANSNATPYPSNAVRLADGDTSIADTLNDRVIIVNSANQTVYQYGKTNVGGNGQGQLNWPYSCYVIGDYTGQTVPQGVSSASTGAAVADVSIPNGTGANSSSGLNFSPDSITVVIGVNNTVMWTNDDAVLHTVTSSSVPAGAQSFNDASLSPGSTFIVTFTTPGTYQYHCSIHSWMRGTVVVKS
ncbi:MAG: plastocyanin/azurin family copper-binding protein, partial [Nitrososphaerales archaeon]